MTATLLSTIDQLIAALTYDEIEQHGDDGSVRAGDTVPLLDRSISHDLIQIERVIGSRGQTLLSANAAAIDEALLLAQQARAMISQLAETRARPNLRAAPEFLRPSVVSKVLKGLEDDFPAAPYPDSGVPDFADPVPGDWPDAPLPEPAEPSREDVNDTRPAVPQPARFRFKIAQDEKITEDGPTDRTPRRREAIGRARRDAEARALEKPVDARIDLIRAAAEKVAAQKISVPQPSAHKPAPTFGVPVAKAAPLPPLPAEQRRARLDAASTFLRGKGVQVSVIDRQAMIRTYRVSGRRDPKLAEDVIAIAIEMGFTEGAPRG